MKIIVERYKSDEDATLSVVRVFDDAGAPAFRCYGLEDEFRVSKVAGETRIPAGDYKMKLRTDSPMADRYRRRYSWCEGIPEILDVPDFTDILIHIGNYETDTDGCLLVGMAANEEELAIYNSKTAFQALHDVILEDLKAGNCSIEFRDMDR